jgi:hypothetical protein
MDVDRLWFLGVNQFPLSKRRPKIFDGFIRILCKLVENAVIGDLLLDGSFLTQEIEPDDLDFTLCVSEEFYLASSGKRRALLDWIGDDKDISTTHLCDCYLCVECGTESPMYFDGIQTRLSWTNLYRFSTVVRRERGIGIIHLTGQLL